MSNKRVAVVTGLSRPAGIATALVTRLLQDGYRVLATGWSEHDSLMPWQSDPAGGATLAASLDPGDGSFEYVERDLSVPEAAGQLIDQALFHFGRIDALVAAHARSSSQGLAVVDVEELDKRLGR